MSSLRKRAPRRFGRGAPQQPAREPARAADPGEIGAAAVALLGRRDFCSAELRSKLVAQGYEPAAVDTVIADLVAQRFVDDVRYAAQFVSYHADRGHGPKRIARDLAAVGVDEALIPAALAEGPDWRQRAREVRIRRFGLDAPANWAEKGRQARFLQYRGFSADHIRSALGPDLDVDDD